MNKYFVLISIYMFFIFYLGFSLVLGTTGMLNYKEMQDYKSYLQENITSLQAINSSLKNQASYLEKKENLVTKAESLGYLPSNSKVIIFDRNIYEAQTYSLGNLCRYNVNEQRFNANLKYVKTLSILLGALIFIFYFIKFVSNGNKGRTGRRFRKNISDAAQ